MFKIRISTQAVDFPRARAVLIDKNRRVSTFIKVGEITPGNPKATLSIWDS
jgi:hypothetical protein